MKKYLSNSILVSLFSFIINAQSIEDALRYARPEISGTPRYISMGGAFNALGGDFSAISVNPAASGVFVNSEFNATLNSNNNQISSSYLENRNSIDSENSNINQFGVVLVLRNTNDGNLSKLSFAYNYQRTHDYENKYRATGTNDKVGLDNYFLAFANGIQFGRIKTYDNETLSESYEYLGNNFGFPSQQAFLGYQGYVIDPFDEIDLNNLYRSNSNPQKQAVDHDFFVSNSGYNSKHSFNISGQFKEKLYLGINLNSHYTEFKRIDRLTEFNYGSGSDFISTLFENDLNSIGSGFSFQIGAIYKLEYFRVGLSYQSPVWYNLTDELFQYLETSKINGIDIVDPRVINIYEYNLKTPSILSVGLARVFGSKGLITLQYDYTDFTNLKFNVGDGDRNFINQNNTIERSLKSAGTLKLGGEYRISRLSLRAGYHNQQSINKKINDKNQGFSFGLGYDLGGSLLNLGILNQKIERAELMYQEGLNQTINLKNLQTQFCIGLTIKL